MDELSHSFTHSLTHASTGQPTIHIQYIPDSAPDPHLLSQTHTRMLCTDTTYTQKQTRIAQYDAYVYTHTHNY